VIHEVKLAVHAIVTRERHEISEEEKAQIEVEQKQRMSMGSSTTGLETNVAGLLCYFGRLYY
jgi:hypothetical protein